MDSTELPLLIGVTGHRDLAEPEKVRGQLECFFGKLASAMPNTRFCLCSGMAAGADQLFIECGKKIFGDRAETLAALPFPRDEYRKDFAPGDECKAYDDLLASSNCITELSDDRDDEAAAYWKVGKYLVDHVNILVSIWDGNIACDLNGNPKKGGTGDISDLWLNYEQYYPDCLFSTFRNPVLIWIEAPRKGNAHRLDTPSPLREHSRLVRFDGSVSDRKFLSHCFSARKVNEALKEIDAYNALRKTETPGRMLSKEYLGLASTNGVENEIERFAILDDSANTAQKQYDGQFLRIFTISLAIGIFAQIYGGIEHSFFSFTLNSGTIQPITWALPTYLLLIILVFAYVLLLKRKKIDNKYLDRRILAEVLRVDIFWKIAGVGKNVKDLFLLKSPEHVEWIVIALNNWSFMDRFAADEKKCGNGTDVKKAWVEDQLNYYEKNAKRLHKRAKKIQSTAIVFAVISMIFGMYFFVGMFFWKEEDVPFYAISGLLISFGSFIMASLNFLLEKKCWAKIAAAYFNKAKLFGIVRDCLTVLQSQDNKTANDEKRSSGKDIEIAMKIDRYATVNDYLAYLGETALQEHEEWLELQRESKPEPNI